ncbi:MAG: Hsp20/alpha crystallin family protein [Anaerolineae bacterium]|nr:Hsp20/alpha crystallin family protein [Anaerolineae bacterium]
MATIMRWNPVREMVEMQRAMDRAFSDKFYGSKSDYRGAWTLPVDAYATDDAIVLKANVPGLKPEELNVTLEGDTLTIRGEVKAEDVKSYLLRERMTGKFERTLTINTPIDAAKVEATFEKGVLTLTLPKAEASKPRQIAVKVSQS